MTATVGFAPATTPGLVTGGTAAAPEESAPEGLFATLLAMLAPPTGLDADIASGTPNQVTSADFAALVDVLKVDATSPSEEADTDPNTGNLAADDAPETAPIPGLDQLTKTAEGKSLLKDLGDALIALNEALGAGQPVDPALEKKLHETLDAVAVYLGTVTPPPPIDPRITALASGDGVLPIAPETPLPPAAPAPADTAATPTTPALPAGEPVPPEAGAAEPPAPKSEATTFAEAPEALRQLGHEIGKLVDKLAEQDPELATKLAALAEALKSATTVNAATPAIEDAAAPEIERIVTALSEPKPKTATAAPQPFTVPALHLPEAVAPAKATAKAEPVAPTESSPTEASEATEPTANVAKPAIVARPVAEAKPEEPAPKPEANASASGAATAADPSSVASSAQAPTPQAVARTIHAAYQTPVQQVNLPQVAFEVVRQFDAGNSRFQIRLDPPELGRIDVKLDVDKSGTINARMTVERPETLDLMQRDQRALQQALQQAGLDTSRANLEFSLRQNPFAQQGGMGDGRNGQPSFARGAGLAAGDDASAPDLATTTYRGTASAGGVNLFV